MSNVDLTLLTPDSVPKLSDQDLFSLDEIQLERVDSNTVNGLLLKSKIRIEKMKRRDKQMVDMIAEAKKSNVESMKSLGATIDKVNSTKQVNLIELLFVNILCIEKLVSIFL